MTDEEVQAQFRANLMDSPLKLMLQHIVNYPTPDKPADAEELFVKPYGYRSQGLNVKGFYDPRMRGYTFSDKTSDDYLQTRKHETGHALADMIAPQYEGGQLNRKRATMEGVYRDNSMKADKSILPKMDIEKGDMASEFMQRFSDILPELRRRYPSKTLYTDPTKVSVDDKEPKRTWAEWNKNKEGALAEAFAELHAMEKSYGLNLDDPAWAHLWRQPGSKEAYRSMTGLRSTTTDPKDIPPQSIDTGDRWYGSAIQQMNKR